VDFSLGVTVEVCVLAARLVLRAGRGRACGVVKLRLDGGCGGTGSARGMSSLLHRRSADVRGD